MNFFAMVSGGPSKLAQFQKRKEKWKYLEGDRNNQEVDSEEVEDIVFIRLIFK